MPVFFGFLLPGGQLVVWAAETADRMIDTRLLALAWNSVSLAAMAAALAVAIAVILAYGMRLRPTLLTAAATRFASSTTGLL